MIFDPYPPPVGSFLLLSVGKYSNFLTPPPFLKSADGLDGWSLKVIYVVLFFLNFINVMLTWFYSKKDQGRIQGPQNSQKHWGQTCNKQTCFTGNNNVYWNSWIVTDKYHKIQSCYNVRHTSTYLGILSHLPRKSDELLDRRFSIWWWFKCLHSMDIWWNCF